MIPNPTDFSITDLYRKVSTDPEAEIIRNLRSKLSNGTFTWVSFVYFAALEMAGWYRGKPDPRHRDAISDSDLVLADGIAFRLLHFAFFHPEIPGWNILFRYPRYSRLAVANLNGTDFVPKVLESFRDGNVRVVLYGTTPETLPKAVAHVRERFGLETAGSHGYAPFPETLLAGDVPVILLVGLGTPRQEKWISDNRSMLEKRGNILVFGVG
jgi:UDP-N-acetyl-D-mannosaminuronic acid transferase (WecB/TagA/CpsF family)